MDEQAVDQTRHYTALRAYLEKAWSRAVPDAQWALLARSSSLQQIAKGGHLISAGDLVEQLYFCTEGLFRFYYMLEDGKEYNKDFAQSGSFLTSYGAMVQQRPSAFSIQALEDCTVIALPYALVQRLTADHYAWEHLLRLCVEQLYLKKEERERQLLFLDAAGRYRLFLEQYPGLAARIPQYHIAAYLGISPVSLSRMTRRAKN